MLIQNNTTVIERSGGVNENKFTIEANGKAFRVLSDSLYPNKPKAIVRELACNAYDAHVAAGNTDVPFDVHLPSNLEPWLTIRDYGIGLTPEEVAGYWKEVQNEDGSVEQIFVGGVYNTFFKSTKTESNDYIGALGLGSKSPFSYVDSFTVISRKDGWKYSFTAYINENDEPEIVELGRERTTEGNGLEVSMPVNKEDFYRFSNEAESVLQWFNPAPKISGNSSFQMHTVEFGVSGTNWAIPTYSPQGYRYGAVAVQGNVAYPIDAGAISHIATPEQVQVLRSNIVLFFDIGLLDVTASRETLSYKGITIPSIINAAQKVIDELPSHVTSELKNAKTEWEARILAAKLFNSSSIINSLAANDTIKIEWNGKTIKPYDNYISINHKGFESIVVHQHFSRYSRHAIASFADASVHKQFSVKPDENLVIVVDDLKRGAISRVRHYRKKNISDMYLITGDSTEVAAFVKAMGEPKTILASSLDKPPVKRSTRASVRILEKRNYGYHFVDSEDGLDIDEGGIFVEVYRDNAVETGTRERIACFEDIVDRAIKLGILDLEATPVYGVTPSVAKKLVENGDWVHFGGHIKEKFGDLVSSGAVIEQCAEYQSYKRLETLATQYWMSHNKLGEWLNDKNHLALQIVSNGKRVSKFDVQKYTAFANSIGFKFDVSNAKSGFDFVQAYNDILAKYPMLTIAYHTYGDERTKTIADYINAIDKSCETV